MISKGGTMSLRDRKSGAIFAAANNSVVAFSLLFLFAFLVIAVNAMFNQSGHHPQPIWGTNEKIITNTISRSQKYTVPVRKVETRHFSSPIIPVPVLRPAPSVPQRALTESVPSETDLKTNAVDPASVQRLLKQLGFYEGPVDGFIGPMTNLAIKKFEQSKYLPESGYISSSLLLLLESALDRATRSSNNSLPRDKASQETGTNGVDPLDSGSNGLDPAIITRIQVGLINFGNHELTIDGVMGNRTKVAIENFQKRFKLEVTGLPTMALVEKLESVGALTKG